MDTHSSMTGEEYKIWALGLLVILTISALLLVVGREADLSIFRVLGGATFKI